MKTNLLAARLLLPTLMPWIRQPNHWTIKIDQLVSMKSRSRLKPTMVPVGLFLDRLDLLLLSGRVVLSAGGQHTATCDDQCTHVLC